MEFESVVEKVFKVNSSLAQELNTYVRAAGEGARSLAARDSRIDAKKADIADYVTRRVAPEKKDYFRDLVQRVEACIHGEKVLPPVASIRPKLKKDKISYSFMGLLSERLKGGEKLIVEFDEEDGFFTVRQGKIAERGQTLEEAFEALATASNHGHRTSTT